MIGTQSEQGIMVRVMGDLFTHSAQQGKQKGVHYKVTVSFLEIYNENIRDLLSDVEEYLDLREDPMKGPVVASITEIETSSSSEVMQLLHQGNAKRSQKATAANENSSRSHAVLQVVVESRDRAPGTVANIKVGKLSLVDLAGSERAANTKNVGARLVEGANINRSLLALGNCINALGEKGNKGNFVPYRDSKLTRLLKDSLGGNCRTVMIANISSAESSFEETLNTLKYANRAKNIKTNVQRNVLNVNYHISEYVQLINNLRGEIQILKGQIGNAPAQPQVVPEPSGRFSPAPAGLPQASAVRNHPATPLNILRESLRSATSTNGEGRDLVNKMRQRIVDNFQERMQLRRSLIELEDQNVQNSIEVSKRQLLVVQWSEHSPELRGKDLNEEDIASTVSASGTPEVREAWQECEQLRKAIAKNNGMKKNIAKRLKHNEREAEKFRDELGDKITGEDRRELMELQYQVGRLELENMELEQHRIVHESILRGKDLVIQKLKLQLAVRDKIIQRQKNILQQHSLEDQVGYSQLALMEKTLMGDMDDISNPLSPPRDLQLLTDNGYKRPDKNVPRLDVPAKKAIADEEDDDDYYDNEYEAPISDVRDISLSARDRDLIEGGDWAEVPVQPIKNNFSDNSVSNTSAKQKKEGNGVSKASKTPSNAAKAEMSSYSADTTPKAQFGANKGVHGPRGGRHFRSSLEENPMVGGSEKRMVHAPNKGGSGPSKDDFLIEDSDNDSTGFTAEDRSSSNPLLSPRKMIAGPGAIDKLEPIPAHSSNSDEGLLSGRGYDAQANNQRRVSHDVIPNGISPRRNGMENNSNYGNNAGFAPIYPSLFNKNGQPGIRTGAPLVATKQDNITPKASDDEHSNDPRYRPVRQHPKLHRRNSRGASEDELDLPNNFTDIAINGNNVGNNNNARAINKGVILGKLRSKNSGVIKESEIEYSNSSNSLNGNPSAPGGNNNGQNLNGNNSNGSFGLNINGNGFMDRQNGGGQILAPVANNRPANRIKQPIR